VALQPVGALIGGLSRLVTGRRSAPAHLQQQKNNLTEQALLAKGIFSQDEKSGPPRGIHRQPSQRADRARSPAAGRDEGVYRSLSRPQDNGSDQRQEQSTP
jgi:hypothetical protein